MSAFGFAYTLHILTTKNYFSPCQKIIYTMNCPTPHAILAFELDWEIHLSSQKSRTQRLSLYVSIGNDNRRCKSNSCQS